MRSNLGATTTLKRLSVAGLALLLSVFLLSRTPAINHTGSRTEQSKPKPISAPELFERNCARCHGGDGRGDTPLGHTYNSPDFTDKEWWKKHADITSTRNLIAIVTNGKGGMPAFGKKLKNSEIKSLVNYVQKFRGQNRER